MARKLNINKWFPPVLTTASLVGLVASTWQAVDKLNLLKNPHQALSCNLSPVIDCSGVLGNHWSSLFGFPNAFIGMAVFAMLLVGGYLLWTKAKFSRAGNVAIWALSLVIILFALWFFGMSLYVIGKVCIFCIFIWTASVPIFWYGSLWSVSNGVFRGRLANKLLGFGLKHHLDVLSAVYLILLVLFFYRFRGYYFG